MSSVCGYTIEGRKEKQECPSCSLLVCITTLLVLNIDQQWLNWFGLNLFHTQLNKYFSSGPAGGSLVVLVLPMLVTPGVCGDTAETQTLLFCESATDLWDQRFRDEPPGWTPRLWWKWCWRCSPAWPVDSRWTRTPLSAARHEIWKMKRQIGERRLSLSGC